MTERTDITHADPPDDALAALEAAGYRRCRHFAHKPYANAFFQRRIRDEHGDTAYFLDAYYYAPFTLPDSYVTNPSWLLELHNNEPHWSFEQHHLRLPENLNVAEQRAHTVWESLGRPYYEREEIPA